MSNKHDANVRKSVLVNFQIGLIASLLFTYVMFEVYTTDRTKVIVDPPVTIVEPVYQWNPNFRVETPKPKEVAVVKKRILPVVDPQKFKVVKDDAALKALTEEFKNSPPVDAQSFDPNSLDPVKDPDMDIPVEVPFAAVEDVPVFPGCEKLKTNKEKAACFNEKIRRLVSKRFNGDIGSRYGLTGEQRIYTMFDVSSDGTIQNVQVRAPHPKLKEEAERVIGLFPKMTPGMQRKKPVTVKYNLPIMFKVRN